MATGTKPQLEFLNSDESLGESVRPRARCPGLACSPLELPGLSSPLLPAHFRISFEEELEADAWSGDSGLEEALGQPVPASDDQRSGFPPQTGEEGLRILSWLKNKLLSREKSPHCNHTSD